MSAVVVGGGAMGCLFAGELAASGTDVTVLDAAPQVVTALAARGVQLVRGESVTAVPVRAIADPAQIGAADTVFIFVKAHHTAAVAAQLPGYLRPATTVVSLQNGWGNADVLARVIPADQLVVGVTYHSCTMLEPGKIAHTGRGPTFVGPYPPGDSLERAEAVTRLLTGAAFEVTATEQVLAEIWRKLVLNAATLPVSALTGLCAADVATSPDALELVDRLALEAVAAGQARGLDIDPEERRMRIRAVLAAAGRGKPSMLQDVQARRKTEVEVINGAVAAAAAQAGLAADLNTAMVALIHGLERSWTQ